MGVSIHEAPLEVFGHPIEVVTFLPIQTSHVRLKLVALINCHSRYGRLKA